MKKNYYYAILAFTIIFYILYMWKGKIAYAYESNPVHLETLKTFYNEQLKSTYPYCLITYNASSDAYALFYGLYEFGYYESESNKSLYCLNYPTIGMRNKIWRYGEALTRVNPETLYNGLIYRSWGDSDVPLKVYSNFDLKSITYNAGTNSFDVGTTIYQSDENVSPPTFTTDFISIAKTLPLAMDTSTIDAEWYAHIYRQGYVVIISSEKEKLYSVLSSPEPMICEKVNRFILSDYYIITGKIRHRFPRAGDTEQVPSNFNLVGEFDNEYYSTKMNSTDEILYTSYDIYDKDGVLIKSKNMDVTKWEPSLEYKSDMLRLYDGNFIKNEGTEDTYILDWLYRELESDLYFTEYEISALSSVESYKKMTSLRTYSDILLDGGYQGNMAQKSEYKFDLSELSKTIAVKSWSDEKVTSAVPDAIYIRPIKMELYDNKVYYGDWLKVTFTYDGNKIIKAAVTDISNVTDNGNGTVTDNTATDPNNYEIDEIKDGLDSLDQYYKDTNTDVLTTVTTTLGQVPDLVAALFLFLPKEIIALLGLSITFVIALMIKRAIL